VTGGQGVRYTYKIVSTSTKSAKGPALDGLIKPDDLRKQLTKKPKQSKGSPKKKVSPKPK
jgi:hypothetical protein